MNQIAIIAMRAVPTSIRADQSLSTIVLFSSVGVLVSFGLIAFGIDLGPAWI